MPTLVYRKGGRPNAYVFAAHDAPVIIGRGLDCTIVVDDGDVSRKHAEIFTRDGGVTWFVRDLGSANGCFLNGDRIQESPISDTDTLRCGRLDFEFRRGPDTSRIVITREQAAFRKDLSTPIHSSHGIGEHFRVRETAAEPSQLSKETRKIGNTSALMQRVRELEQKVESTERENRRLRDVISQLVEHADDDLLQNLEQHSDEAVENVREHLAQSVENLQASALAVFADFIQSERRRNPFFDRVSTIVSRSKERQRMIHDEEE